MDSHGLRQPLGVVAGITPFNFPAMESSVTLWVASADAPAQLAEVRSDAEGRFVLSVDQTPGLRNKLGATATSLPGNSKKCRSRLLTPRP